MSTSERLSLSSLCVVLVEPSLPENVGSVARAMDNMGVSDLRLVNPCDYQDSGAKRLATRSTHVLDAAQCYPDLATAVADCHVVIATTARRRERFDEPISLPDIHQHLPAGASRVAVVFGRESSGLNNAEMACCTLHIRIPTHGESHSLNLAQAVLVLLYELARPLPDAEHAAADVADLATSGEVEGLKGHVFDVLGLVGFLRPHQRENMWYSFSDLIGRARMNKMDVRLIRGFLSRTQGKIRRISAQTARDTDSD